MLIGTSYEFSYLKETDLSVKEKAYSDFICCIYNTRISTALCYRLNAESKAVKCFKVRLSNVSVP